MTLPPSRLALAVLLLFAAALIAAPAAAQVRIKDIADVEGIRDNQLVGYGLVVGLNGTGDKLSTSVFTRESLVAMLERLGVNTRDQLTALSTKNVAAVVVTANLPAFARVGSRIDVAISALGDATNLTGGVLLVTPLLGADGAVYAVGAGRAVDRCDRRARRRSLGDARRADRRAHRQRGHRGARGALRAGLQILAAPGVAQSGPDHRRAHGDRHQRGPRRRYGTRARPGHRGSGTRRPRGGGHARPRAGSAGEPDMAAVVIVEEASGTIVMGSNVRISTVAIAQGNLTIRVAETPEVSQPNALGGDTATTVPRTRIEVDDDHDRKLGILRGNVTLRDLVASLDALGVGPRDMISILQSIKAAGALQADLEVR